jgi:leucyl aminopeptidase
LLGKNGSDPQHLAHIGDKKTISLPKRPRPPPYSAPDTIIKAPSDMQFSIANTLAPSLPVTVIPLQDNELLANYLQDLSALAGITFPLPFKAKHKEVLPIIQGGRCHYLLGLGPKSDFASLCQAFSHFYLSYRDQVGEQLGVNASRVQLPARLLGEAVANGFMLGDYRIGLYKSEQPAPAAPRQVWVQHEDALELGEGLLRGKMAGETQCRIMDLVNAPANKMRPTELASWAMASGDQYGYLVEVFSRKAMEELGMTAVLSVGKASVQEPLCIVAQYAPAKGNPEDYPHVGLVGKGVTYDTGGLSIKTNNMHYMKSDMGGAAAVLGAVELAAKWQLPVRITCVVPAVENDVDALSMKPGDVIGSFSGKTIEVVDTDAEGRLVMADALAFLQHEFKPDMMVDVATLTGNSVLSLSTFAAALCSNDDALAEALSRAGFGTGEKLWRMPLWEEYGVEMLSEIADVRNYSGRGQGGAITAAKFLEHFIGGHPRWAHIDIAPVAFGATPYGKQYAATAFGVRLLTAFMQGLQ